MMPADDFVGGPIQDFAHKTESEINRLTVALAKAEQVIKSQLAIIEMQADALKAARGERDE